MVITALSQFCSLSKTDAVAFSNARYGTGTGPIHLDSVGCIGSESSLIECSHSSFVSCFYGHSEDAGVRCQGECYTAHFLCITFYCTLVILCS